MGNMKALALTVAMVVSGCNFAVDGVVGGGGGGGADVDLSTGGGDDLGSGDDLATGNDIAGVPIICTAGSASCNGSTLVTCPDGTAQMMTTCPLGCGTTGGAHCNLMYPRAPVTRGDFDTTGLMATTLSASSVYIGADTGLIGPGNAPIRHANTTATTYEVHDGVGFHLVAIPGSTLKLGIYTFSSLTVDANVVMNAYGTNGIALVSAGNMTIDGQLDATCAGNVNLAALFGAPKPWLAGPGGGAGGQPGTASVGFGAGAVGGVNGDIAHGAGGGGGAYFDVGGAGGAQGGNLGGASGPIYGDAILTTLWGGSGAGAGGQSGGSSTTFGGGGGGLVLLVAQGTVTLGAGNMTGGVNAGGCGGTTNPGVGGGAGGSGGAVLVQAIAVHVAANGAIAANGGSGAAGNAVAGAATNGKPGALAVTAATGGQTGGGAAGGNGGAAATTNGATGGGAGGAAGSGAGGGGGGVGRVRLESQSGAATVDVGAAVSPAASQSTVDIH
jgi:hypothetical protein